MELVVIGHQDAVWGFALVGVQGYVAATEQAVNHALDQALADSRIGIILVTEDAAELVDERLARLKAYSNTPLVLEIPAPGGHLERRPTLADTVLQSTGVRV